MLYTRDYKIDNSGNSDVTTLLQNLINEAQNDAIYIDGGTYLVSNLYVNSNTEIILDSNSIILGTNEESKYDIIKTRVAGINMDWYPAIINVIDANNVKISGGKIVGAGEYFYEKYWGRDKKGGMRKEYDSKGLRWACDYDCKRVRNMLISNSFNVEIKDIKLYESGFWNIHILYSHDILIDNVYIKSDCKFAPSTDGIDVDSSHDIKIINSVISTNDDSISLKSGRDYDGYITNIPTYNVTIKNCVFYNGYGISFGSELSAGIYDIDISHIALFKTDCAIRIKSSESRKGYVKNINIKNIVALDVKYLFNFNLDWNKGYSKASLPKGVQKKDYYDSLLKKIEKEPNTLVSNINVDYVFSEVFDSKISRIFTLIGYDDVHMNNISFNHMNIVMKEYGIIKNVDGFEVNKSILSYDKDYIKKNDDFDNR